MKTLIIDNYDSYTYNLYQMIAEINDEEPIVIKNDEMGYEDLLKLDFDNVIISPGPGNPDNERDFGICRRVLLELDKPILGVCLGQQGLYSCYGGKVILAPEPVHGRLSKIYHNSTGLFEGVEQGTLVTRYHSLVCEDKPVKNIRVDAKTEDGLIMAISHETKPIWAVQFHPESICSSEGRKMLENFYRLSKIYLGNSRLAYKKIELSENDDEIFYKLYKYDDRVIWLDSSSVIEDYSRFSIYGLSSKEKGHYLTYRIDTKKVEKIYLSGEKESFDTDIFSFLKENKKNWEVDYSLPFDFQLGYIGYFGYELKKDTMGVSTKGYKYPDAYFKYIDRAVVIDHKGKEIYLLAEKNDVKWIEEIENFLNQPFTKDPEVEPEKVYPRIKFVRDEDQYIKDVEYSKELIKEGETYEVCLTNRLDIMTHLEPVKYYMKLRQISPAPYAAFMNLGEIAIASSSMERFITVDRNRIIETKPIKGTIRRGITQEEDYELIQLLAHDEKTRAENLMIVDLLRNDLGKVSKIGTVRVPKLMQVETYSTLHQLVTTITGKIDDKFDEIDVIKACFPGGSMTGAPKKRTLEIIDSIEKIPRGIYSGSIGFISNSGTLDFNIVIRTAIIEKEKTTVGVGGAVIALSDPLEEFEETVLKAKGILKALQAYYDMETDVKIENIKEENERD